MFPLLLLGLGTAAAAAVAVAASSSSSSVGTFSRIPLTRTAEPLPTPEQFVNRAIEGAAAYAELLADANATPADVTPDQLEALGREFKEGKEKLEKDTLKQWDRTVDAYAGAIEAGLEKTGVGILLVPFVEAGAYIMKWGAKASTAVAKFLTNNGDAFSNEWKARYAEEKAWLDERHIPYQGFVPGRDTPRGWVTGLNDQAAPTYFGASALRVSFQRMPLADVNNAMSAFDVMFRTRARNPFVRAMWGALQLALWSPNWGGGDFLLTSEQTEKMSREAKIPSDRYQAAFSWCMVAAIATGVAMDYALPVSAYQTIALAAWHGWDKAVSVYVPEFYAQPPGEWREGPIGVGIAGYPVASAFAHAVAAARKVKG